MIYSDQVTLFSSLLNLVLTCQLILLCSQFSWLIKIWSSQVQAQVTRFLRQPWGPFFRVNWIPGINLVATFVFLKVFKFGEEKVFKQNSSDRKSCVNVFCVVTPRCLFTDDQLQWTKKDQNRNAEIQGYPPEIQNEICPELSAKNAFQFVPGRMPIRGL